MLNSASWIRVIFTETEIATIERVAAARQSSKDALGLHDGKLTDRSGNATHAIGFAAEYALAKVLDVQPDMTISAKGHGGVSLKAFGATFNTHYNKLAWGDLRYRPKKVPKVTFCVLVTGDLPRLYLCGWATRDEVMRGKEELTLNGQGVRWLYERSKLHPMADIQRALGVKLPRLASPNIDHEPQGAAEQMGLFDLGGA